MSVETVRQVLVWCAAINCLVLLIWFLLFALPHAWLYRIWSRWFALTREQFDAINFGGIVLYEIGVLLFNLAPYLALRIAG